MGRTERKKELARRRHRRVKLAHLRRRSESASPSEKVVIAEKIRQLTPGGSLIIEKLGLEER